MNKDGSGKRRVEGTCMSISKGLVKLTMAPHWKRLIYKSTETDLHSLTWKQCPEQVVK